MEAFNWKFFILAILVVFMFIAVGFAIALRSVSLIVLFILLGFGLMGYGLVLKKRQKRLGQNPSK
ncbi:DUF5325 family protein [Oceanobacillus alkalisoli]|uniref:DUF5325 family protein n=2 Tax=Oceanobacillus alkalisoli TaxID=2925113 RepID=UPI001F11A9F5|nr:DUF5325 family protein [Oceanobacillus alkalisoli]MCF3941951.1 YlaF family protein [Oceanobacillus alkalisoli]